MKEKTKGQRSLAVLIVAVIVVALIGIIMPLSASAEGFDSPFVKYDNVVISYTLADFEPSASYSVAAFDAISYFCTYTEIDFFTMIGAYSFYKANQGNYIVAEYKNSDVDDGYGYIFWRDDAGAYQHLMWKVADEDDSSSDTLSSDITDSSYNYATVTGTEFAEMAQMYYDHYGPKNTTEYISWRTDTRFADFNDTLTTPRLSFFREGYFCNNTDWQEVYLVPCYSDDTGDYFSPYQFHFYQEISKDDDGNNIITLYYDVWDMLNGGEVQTLAVSAELMDYRYIDFCVPNDYGLAFTLNTTYTQYIKKTRSKTVVKNFVESAETPWEVMYSSDLLATVDVSEYLYTCWQQKVAVHDAGECSNTAYDPCTIGELHDLGYYCSNKPIEMDFSNVDFSKFTADDTVTLSGDTIYDYTITNNTTGDTTTVNNYITNNYTYPESDSGDSGEEGGGSAVSGNVNVSGDIDVGGQVDINVNIEQSSSGSSSDFLDPVDDYAQYLPEVAPEVTEYLETTYSFLPPEIIGLLIGGIGVAILCRILGR